MRSFYSPLSISAPRKHWKERSRNKYARSGDRTRDLLHDGRALTDCAILAPFAERECWMTCWDLISKTILGAGSLDNSVLLLHSFFLSAMFCKFMQCFHLLQSCNERSSSCPSLSPLCCHLWIKHACVWRIYWYSMPNYLKDCVHSRKLNRNTVNTSR